MDEGSNPSGSTWREDSEISELFPFLTPEPNQSTGLVGISDNNLKLLAYPNPFKEELRVKVLVPNLTPSTKLSLIEPASGRIMFEKIITSNDQEFTIPTNELSSGLYLIGVSGGNFPAKFTKVTNVH